MPVNNRLTRRVFFESLETRVPFAADLSIDVSINGHTASANPMEVAFGSDLDFIYEVRNTGDMAIGNLSISDDAGTLAPSDDFAPAPLTTSGETIGELGDLKATFPNLKALRFIQHPHKPLMYASVTSHNSVAVINTETLELEALIPVGSYPYGMAITEDGSKLYVATGTTNYIAILNTETLKVEPKLYVKEQPLDVEVARDGTLFVLSLSQLTRINPATGQELERFEVFAYSGELAINAAKDRLYYADYGLSPASLYAFDVTTNPASLLWESPNDDSIIGSSGRDLALSHDGTFISFATGGGPLGYRIAKFNTSNMANEGSFDTGPYPQEITFSPDDILAYTVNGESAIKTWDTSLFAPRGAFPVVGKAEELWVDRTGRYLFAAFANEIRVYSTGRSLDVNVGDLNGNGSLDPGESWRFASSTQAAAGRHLHRIAVAGTGSDEMIISDNSVAAYFGTLSAKVKENVNGVETIKLRDSKNFSPDDTRFVIVDDMLRTKSEEHLTASFDNGIRVKLLDKITKEVLHIVDLTVQEDSVPWHNQAAPMDVNEDGELTPLDALLVINDLNLRNARKLEGLPVGIAWQIDCNADGSVSPLDALMVVNTLNRRGEGEYQGDLEIHLRSDLETTYGDFFLPMSTEEWESWRSEREKNKGRR